MHLEPQNQLYRLRDQWRCPSYAFRQDTLGSNVSDSLLDLPDAINEAESSKDDTPCQKFNQIRLRACIKR